MLSKQLVIKQLLQLCVWTRLHRSVLSQQKTASTVLSPLAGCIFMCLKLVKDMIVTQ